MSLGYGSLSVGEALVVHSTVVCEVGLGVVVVVVVVVGFLVVVVVVVAAVVAAFVVVVALVIIVAFVAVVTAAGLPGCIAVSRQQASKTL